MRRKLARRHYLSLQRVSWICSETAEYGPYKMLHKVVFNFMQSSQEQDPFPGTRKEDAVIMGAAPGYLKTDGYVRGNM